MPPPKSKSQLQPFKVYVRWRPLSPTEPASTEIERTHTQHDNSYLSVSLASPQGDSQSTRRGPWKSSASFTQVFEATAGNRDVFEAAVAPTLSLVMNGRTCNFFAYGHSGSGKTHTIIGYDYYDNDKLGLCLSAARDLFGALDGLNADCSSSSSSSDDSRLGIGIRLYEMRKKSAFDLLNGHKECYVRQGEDGRTHIRGETEMLEGGKVRVCPIVTRPCWNLDELRRELQDGLKLRATGSSTVHDQSSRTHAVLELEVVNKALLDARDAVIEWQSELVPVAKRATDIYLEENAKAFIRTPEGKYIPNPEHPPNQARIDAAEAEKEKYESYLKMAEDRVTEVFKSSPHSCLGGKFVFVDLAGSEYYNEGKGTATGPNQTAQERQEGRQINADLFALKEVIRARALNQARIPFRSSPLTMVLREHFLGSSNDTQSAMILTVSPSSEQYAATMNTLKYGNLVGVAGGDRVGVVKS